MGIPSFYRWLVEKYPLAVANVVEDPPYTTVDGVEIPLDSSKPNPNGMEFDNLYLDMNGIIHPCFHPEGQPPPKSYDEVFKAVFKYTDRIFSIVRPRKLLYMAIDGVAPRAKMNQQRARRFKAAKEAADAAAKERPENVIEVEGEKLQSMDSNIITPGTEFMASLSAALQYYIHLRMNTDPGWRGVKVILSDASVVGEGEHKIMSYIRSQRNRNGYDPNTRHCLYGLDADLIMLALASHEIHFSILREDVAKVQHNMGRSQKWKDFKHRNLIHGNRYLVKGELGDKEAHDYISSQKFQFFNVWILREYLAHEMNIPRAEKLERLLDDFVFMCLFVGNDFLPHVPSLEISEGAIELLMTVYKKEFVKMGGYLTESFKVNLKRVEHFMQAVGCHEDAIFRRRSQVQKGYATSKAKQGSTEARNLPHPKQNSQTFWSTVDLTSKSTDQLLPSSGAKEAKPPLANEMANGTSEIVHNSDAKELKGTPSKAMANGASETVDNIKLGEEGWKGRFYFEKFKAKTEDERDCIRKHAVLKYIEGMCWVMHYYYEGVCSWQWFYPYHYAPFASDFYDLENIQIHFMLGQPFKPFDQLMGVLPPASAHALPLAYRGLMLDPSSPILDLYPTDFELDMNGKRHEWQAICKLPFIEESRLLTEIAKVEHTLTDEEKRRNSLGMDMLFVHFSHPLEGTIYKLSNRSKCHSKLTEAKAKCTIDPKISGGMNGYIYISDRTVGPRDINSPVGDMENITANKVLTVFYGYPATQVHSSKLPKGVVMPRMSIRKEDAPVVSVLWHEKSGVLGRVHYERPIAKSVSGSCLVTLAHQLVLEYYADKRKENSDPSVFERLIARFVPSRPNELKKKPVEKVPKKENNVAGTESGKRKRKRRAAAKGRQDTEVVSILGDRAVSDPPCPTQSNSVEVERPEKRNNSFAATTSVREKCMSGAPDDKSQEHVTSAVLFGHSAIDAPLNPTLPDSVVFHVENMDLGKAVETVLEKEHAAAGTVSGKKKRRRKASATGRQVSEAALVLGHSALSDPSCPTEPNLKETTKPEERENDFAATTTAREKYMSGAPEDKSQEHVTTAVLVGHSATDAPLDLTLPDCVVVHEKNMDPGSCMDLGKFEEKVLEKENAVAGTVSGKKKRKRKASATRRQVSEAGLVLAHSALSDPSAPTELNFIETTKPEERENSFAATTSVREKCMSGAPDDKSQEHITSAVLVGHRAIDAPKLGGNS